MAVQIAFEVLEFDECGETLRLSRRDLTAVFPQLGFDIRQSHRSVDRFFRVAGHPLVALEYAIFVDLEAALLAQAAYRDVVRLGAREILQGRAEALDGDDPQVHLQAGTENHGGAGRAL